MKEPVRDTAEFKELAVRQVKEGQGIGALARELGRERRMLRNWIKAADASRLSMSINSWHKPLAWKPKNRRKLTYPLWNVLLSQQWLEHNA